MTADIQDATAGMGTKHQRAVPTDAGDTTRESLEGKKGPAKTNVNISQGAENWRLGSSGCGIATILQVSTT